MLWTESRYLAATSRGFGQGSGFWCGTQHSTAEIRPPCLNQETTSENPLPQSLRWVADGGGSTCVSDRCLSMVTLFNPFEPFSYCTSRTITHACNPLTKNTVAFFYTHHSGEQFGTHRHSNALKGANDVIYESTIRRFWRARVKPWLIYLMKRPSNTLW